MKNTGEFSVTTPTDRQIVMTRTFDAPRAVVFEAWTKAEHVAHWWDPSGVPLSICEIDLRPDGGFRWINLVNGVEFPFTGTYLEIAPPERLVFTARTFPSSPESMATLTFIESLGKTTLKMTIECRSIEDRDAMLQMRVDAGTARTLENLAEYLHQIE
jgi:uncharacterized protein YndB with AHSA1/START domain